MISVQTRNELQINYFEVRATRHLIYARCDLPSSMHELSYTDGRRPRQPLVTKEDHEAELQVCSTGLLCCSKL
jgi:hypothetical protein